MPNPGAPSDVVDLGLERVLELNDRSELTSAAHTGPTSALDESSPSRAGEPEVESWEKIRPGARLGNWILDRSLGKGGFGQVWSAHHHAEPTLLAAVKVLLEAKSADAIARQRFREEVRAAIRLTQGLDSPFIARIKDVGELADRTPWFAMELLRGESLARRLSRGPLTQAELQLVAHGTCEGAAKIHDAGLVHRDIKPANIFICEQPPSVKILDLGLVKSTASLTGPAVRLGTLAYASPEIYQRGARDVDARADLHAIAVVLFECITGDRAFERPSEAEMVDAVTSCPAERLPWAETSARVRAVLTTALAKRPEDRQPDVRTFHAALAVAIAGDETDSPHEGSRSAPTLSVPRRVRWTLAVILVACVATATAIASWS